MSSWLPWAMLSAVFAALTAIFAKVGLERINSDFATLVLVIALTLGALSADHARRARDWDDRTPGNEITQVPEMKATLPSDRVE